MSHELSESLGILKVQVKQHSPKQHQPTPKILGLELPPFWSALLTVAFREVGFGSVKVNDQISGAQPNVASENRSPGRES